MSEFIYKSVVRYRPPRELSDEEVSIINTTVDSDILKRFEVVSTTNNLEHYYKYIDYTLQHRTGKVSGNWGETMELDEAQYQSYKPKFERLLQETGLDFPLDKNYFRIIRVVYYIGSDEPDCFYSDFGER